MPPPPSPMRAAYMDHIIGFMPSQIVLIIIAPRIVNNSEHIVQKI